MTSADSEARFRRTLVASILALSVAKALLHEPWRDEWGPWGVALASGSYLEFLGNLRYGGHPVLWHTLVFALQRTIGSFVAVQLLQALIATATAYVVARWAPFPRPLRVLLLAGYFPFFEYSAIARPYGIALLATCAACAVYVARPREPVLLAGALAVLVHTTVYGLFVAVAIAAAWALDALLAPRRGLPRPAARPTVAAGLILVAACALAVVVMRPPADSGFAVGWQLEPDLDRAELALGAVARGLVPLPRPGLHFWNRPVVDLLGPGRAILGAALLVAVALLHRRRPSALLLWTAGTAAIAAFTYVKYAGGIRHHGHVFVAFLAASWIAAAADHSDRAERPAAERARRIALAVVLGVHAVGGLAAAGADALLPFSASRVTARFLTSSGLDRLPIVGNPDPPAAAVAAALGRPILFPASGRTSTYVAWDNRRRPVVASEVFAAADRVRNAPGGEVVLLLNRALTAPPEGITLVASFDRSVVANEVYFVYVDRRPAR